MLCNPNRAVGTFAAVALVAGVACATNRVTAERKPLVKRVEGELPSQRRRSP
jgi:hypothetical protein